MTVIEEATGNLLEANAEALVNTVNIVGVMGKGIALQFKQAFPENFLAYEKACKQGEVKPGEVFVFETGQLANPHYIINFPTKRHWRQKARIEDIELGLVALVRFIKEKNIKSIALPPLGCGNGGLSWGRVRPIIETALGSLEGLHVLLYAPKGAPKAEHMPVKTKRPRMTRTRAILLAAMEQYALPGYKLSMLEIQKLTYFLATLGEPITLKFVKEKYGPYAEQLHHVLQRMEGHFIRGYGDRSRDAELELISDAVGEASKLLEISHEARDRLELLSELIEGFETPYGMELLATVHWVIKEDEDAASSLDIAINGVHEWSEYKKERFPAKHIALAWERLRNQHWIA